MSASILDFINSLRKRKETSVVADALAKTAEVLTNPDAKRVSFLNEVSRQSFIKHDPELPYPVISDDGSYDPKAFSAWLEKLGYIDWKGQLRLARIVVLHNIRIREADGVTYME